jgi:DNA polymerase III delta subunit
MITVDKPLSAHNIHIVFKCEELDSSKKQSTTIFSVDSVIWGKAKEDSGMNSCRSLLTR